jgi:hypothetical protein
MVVLPDRNSFLCETVENVRIAGRDGKRHVLPPLPTNSLDGQAIPGYVLVPVLCFEAAISGPPVVVFWARRF